MKTISNIFDWFEPSDECSLWLPPVPASRPKVGRWGTYYGKNYAAWKNKADQLLREQAVSNIVNEPVTGPLIVLVEQVCKKPRTTKRHWPVGDVDNHAKGPLDAVTRSSLGWIDDDQIIALMVIKRFAEQDEEPRSIIRWSPIQI